MDTAILEQRVAKLEKQMQRLLRGKSPESEGRDLWARIEDRHLKAWERQGGIDHLDKSKHLTKTFAATPDERDDIAAYLTKRGTPFTQTASELVVVVDRGTVRLAANEGPTP